MNSETVHPQQPRILVVDDERQIHASLRLRLGKDYALCNCANAQEALEKIRNEQFDVCFADIHMPQMDGFAFIEAARAHDPGLGYVILSAFDTDENLRRTIPLQVYDFVSKPLPEKKDFENRIPEWVMLTRHRRSELALAGNAAKLTDDRDAARLERDVEFVASETARDALLETTGLLTTIHAQLMSASAMLAPRLKVDSSLMLLARTLQEAFTTTDAAMSATSSFFDSAYGNRDSSPAVVSAGINQAIVIARRLARSEESCKAVDFSSTDDQTTVRDVSGIAFLLMLVPAISAALIAAAAKTTVGVQSSYFPRLEAVPKDPRWRDYAWLNRRNSAGSQAGTLISIAANAPALSRTQIDNWLKGEHPPFANITVRGLMTGIHKARGVMGIAVAPQTDQFRLLLALPTDHMTP